MDCFVLQMLLCFRLQYFHSLSLYFVMIPFWVLATVSVADMFKGLVATHRSAWLTLCGAEDVHGAEQWLWVTEDTRSTDLFDGFLEVELPAFSHSNIQRTRMALLWMVAYQQTDGSFEWT